MGGVSPYPDRTGRPAWSALPAGLRAAVAERLGGPVVAVRAAADGFTSGFAGVLRTAGGNRAFVKAAADVAHPHLVEWYAREWAILDRLPVGLPVPRPRFAVHAEGWSAFGVDAVDGRSPRDADELAATLAGYADVATALADPPVDLLALRPPHLADLARDDLLRWGDVAAGREPFPALPAPLRHRLPELVALESRLPAYAATPGLVHGDLRPDNVLIDPAGRAWFCDWTWLSHGPAWFDLVTLLLPHHEDLGPAVDSLVTGHPAAAGAAPDAVDVTLAALAGYFLATAAEPPPPTASPALPAHQRRNGDLALGWLARRQGWG
ncbi:phosphotransferase family protein [Micromonospora endolithica]|uniref:Aminoglycoside phosphotransferase family protein n=1 Tax=Micromonospora endolithica TaxID=230091 RepID=A0A3A9Z5Q9_9ACTN|nr:aminoglycoside phosphotransferase family protein [Micromonospora endolithica]